MNDIEAQTEGEHSHACRRHHRRVSGPRGRTRRRAGPSWLGPGRRRAQRQRARSDTRPPRPRGRHGPGPSRGADPHGPATRRRRPAGQQREHARGQPDAVRRRPVTADAHRDPRDQRGRAPRAHPVAAPPAAGHPRHRRERHLRRLRRAVRRLGRLRLLQGGPGPPHPHPGRRAADAARLCRRPRRHAHPDAPGRLPGRGHLRPAGAGDRGPPPAGVARVRACRAAATGLRTSASRRPRHERPGVRASRSPARRTRLPRPAAWLATRSACWWPRPTGWSTGRRSTCPTSSTPGTCSSSTPRRRCPPPSTCPATSACCTCRPSSTTATGWWSCACPTARGRRRPGGRDARTSRAGCTLTRARSSILRASRRLWRATPSPATDRAAYLLEPRSPDPLPLPAGRLAALGLAERLRRRAGQRRDAERRPAAVRAAAGPPDGARVVDRPDRAAHGRLEPGGSRAAAARAVRRARVDRATRGIARDAGRRVSPWAPRWFVPWSRWPTQAGECIRRPAGRRSCWDRSAPPARWTGC